MERYLESLLGQARVEGDKEIRIEANGLHYYSNITHDVLVFMGT